MTIYHCPCCNEPMDAITCVFELLSGTREIVQVTCYTEGCQFRKYTVSPDTANDPAKLINTYHITPRYDVYTGQELDNA